MCSIGPQSLDSREISFCSTLQAAVWRSLDSCRSTLLREYKSKTTTNGHDEALNECLILFKDKNRSLNNVRYSFSIRDLENFSGIKAHTIRIWEKRYSLLEPDRTEGNQRTYDLHNLQKLLNIKLLYENGHKISKIASYGNDEINHMVTDIITSAEDAHKALDAFKVAMLNFDQCLFERNYIKLISNLSFRRVFMDVFIPLLEQLGYLWQANSITPAHEHFISNLIQQKILANIERVQVIQHHKDERVYALYLPHGEIHDLGLLYFHYELTLRGYKSIYLGQSIRLDNLEDVRNVYSSVTFVSYFTVKPEEADMEAYLKDLEESIVNRPNDRFWLLGRRVVNLKNSDFKGQVSVFKNLEQEVAELTE